jgi:hypothetical protein
MEFENTIDLTYSFVGIGHILMHELLGVVENNLVS